MTVKPQSNAPASDDKPAGHISSSPEFPTIADRSTFAGQDDDTDTTTSARTSPDAPRNTPARAEAHKDDGNVPVKIEPRDDDAGVRGGLASVAAVAATRAAEAPTSATRPSRRVAVKLEPCDDDNDDAELFKEEEEDDSAPDGRVLHPSVSVFGHVYPPAPTVAPAVGANAEAGPVQAESLVPPIACLDEEEDEDEEDQLDPDQYIYNREEYGLDVKPEPVEDRAWSTASSKVNSVLEHMADTGVYPDVASATNTPSKYTSGRAQGSATTAAEEAATDAAAGEEADAESETNIDSDVDAEGESDHDEEPADAQETAADAADALDNAAHTAELSSHVEDVAAANGDNGELELIDGARYDASDSSSNEATIGSDTPDMTSDASSTTSSSSDDLDAAPVADPLARCPSCGHIHLSGPRFYQDCTAFVGPQADAAGMTAYHPFAYIHGDAARKVPVANISNAVGVEIAVRASLARCLEEKRAFQERRWQEDQRRREEQRRAEEQRRSEEQRRRAEDERRRSELKRPRYEQMLRACGYAPSGAVRSLSAVTRGYGGAVQATAHVEVPRMGGVQSHARLRAAVPSLSCVTRGYGRAADATPAMANLKRGRGEGDESDEEEGRAAKAARR